MLGNGFEYDVRRILSQIRPDRQVLFFSATWLWALRTISRAQESLKNTWAPGKGLGCWAFYGRNRATLASDFDSS